MSDKKILLETKSLKKYFHTPSGELHAVDDVNMQIVQGQTLGVVGESGCGKSTLGRTILRLSEPNSGQIFFDGKDILKCGRKDMQNLRTDADYFPGPVCVPESAYDSQRNHRAAYDGEQDLPEEI